jgi:hypothetical protein
MTFRLVDLAGRYRLVVTADLREHIERTFVSRAPEGARDQVRAEALHEAEGSEIEITAEAVLISRSHGREFLRVTLGATSDAVQEVCFEKAGSPARLRLIDRDTVVVWHADKPPTVFQRA